jgi:hypothetical protein
MFDLLIAPAMAATPDFTTVSELVDSYGLVRTSRELSMSNNTLVKRVKEPGTFTLPELTLLAKMCETDLLTIISRVARETNPELFTAAGRKGVKELHGFTTIAELIHSFGGRYSTATRLEMSPNTLATRMKKPEGFMLAELVLVAKIAETDLLTVAKLAQHQMDTHLPPPAPALGRPPFN